MGLNLAALGLMALARASGADFSRVVMIGRQRLDVSAEALGAFFQKRHRADIASRMAAEPMDGYCERLLAVAFGASVVQSIDASNYEQADIVHDMNTQLEPTEHFSAVLDFGTLEHVFNIAMAFDNVARLCAPGAHILHVLPSNNFVGHGFYQFSPELFFQIYSPERGFQGTRVFAAPGGTPDLWYEVRAPRELGARVEFTSRDQLYLLVITQKAGEPTPLMQQAVQQSDYVQLWRKKPRQAAKDRRRGPVARMALAASTGMRHRLKVARKDVSSARGDMIPRPVLLLTPDF